MYDKMKFVAAKQGWFEEEMRSFADTPLTFQVPPSGRVLLLAQATALCASEPLGSNVVGVKFSLWINEEAPKGTVSACANGVFPARSTVCMAYLDVSGLTVGTEAKVTIDLADETVGGGTISDKDYYSIAVVELEHDLAMSRSLPTDQEAK